MATKAELQEALEKANGERGEDDQIVPDGSTKADLEKALSDAGFEVDEAASGKPLYVSGPLVSATVSGSRVIHLYKGDVVPSDITKESLENLQSLGYVSDEPQQ
jgi:hypothetical protein